MVSVALKSSPPIPPKRSFREQMHIAREDAIVMNRPLTSSQA